jgi:hypothetical protein
MIERSGDSGARHRLLDPPADRNGVSHNAFERRFADRVLSLTDPDGMSLAIVATAGVSSEPSWSDGTIPAEHASRWHEIEFALAPIETDRPAFVHAPL